MNLEIKGTKNYSAVVVQLNNLRKHENADRLQCASVFGFTVITDLTAQEKDYYVYFPVECCINKDFLRWLNAFDDKTLNADPEQKGFFNKHGRVRAMKLRGTRSEGFIIPTRKLAEWLAVDEGELNNQKDQSFDTVNGISICKKYVPALPKGSGKTNRKQTKAKITIKLVDNQFRLHTDTDNLRRNLKSINSTDFISVSYKLHGTNATIGKILCKRSPNKLKLLWDRIFKNKPETEYQLVWGSRRVVKNAEFSSEQNNANHFYDADVWGLIAKQIEDKIENGITLYGEIVGYAPNGAMIQKDYDYGCDNPLETTGADYNQYHNHSKFYVFRITYTAPDGRVHEFLPSEIKAYCIKHNLNFAEIYYDGLASEFLANHNTAHENFGEALAEKLSELFLERNCHMCKNEVPNEGVVVSVRPAVEGLQFFDADVTRYKLKSFAFLDRESKNLDSGEVGLEEMEEANAAMETDK